MMDCPELNTVRVQFRTKQACKRVAWLLQLMR